MSTSMRSAETVTEWMILSILCILAAASADDMKVVKTAASTCVLKEHSVKCWGQNGYGRLGVGHTDEIHQPPADPIDLGSDFVPADLQCGGNGHCCVISTEKSMKCWGYNVHGQLGYGDQEDRGDDAGEMGDNLLEVELPSDFELSDMEMATMGTCVFAHHGDVYCWGYNQKGQFGLGHTNSIGDDANEMGDNLVATDLGSDFFVEDMMGSGIFVCALSSAGKVKCWGKIEDYLHFGDKAGDMGDNLPYVDLGAGFIVDFMECGGSGKHCCAIGRGNEGLKCFGRGNEGQLGYGDNSYRDIYDEDKMGDFLPVVPLEDGFEIQSVECGDYSTCIMSTAGTVVCWGSDRYNSLKPAHTAIDVGSGFTASEMTFAQGSGSRHHCIYEVSDTDLLAKCWETNDYGQLGYGDTQDRGEWGGYQDSPGPMGDDLPFIDFGSFPAVVLPTASPTEPVCDEVDMTSVNWHDLLNSDEQETSLLQSYAVDFDASTLSLTLKATVQYVGQSADGNFDDDFNLGTTYWMDFQSFSTIDGGVDSAGSCGNRRSADYTDLSFEQFWEFPVNPADLDEMETAERMAYPPSEWDLQVINCTVIEYERTLSWTELTACSDADGDVLVEITETDDAVLLEGTFFVELVSPYSSTSDEYYRTFPLLQQGFRVALNREVNALSSTGVQLFIPSVMAYGLDDEGNYEVTVLVQSADYVMLGMDEESIASISSPLAVTGFETVNADCLVASSFTCGQIFTATIPASCSDDDSVIDLSGTYQFGFTPQCRILEDGSTEPACDVFMTTLDDAGKVVLEVDASFVDQCDVDLFEVTFDGDLAFFADAELSVAVDDGSDPFVIGQDTIYGKVTVDIPDDEAGAMYDFVTVSIENVYVCTAEDELSVDGESGLGGCLSPDIVDDDGPYTVIGSGAVADYQGTTDFDVAANNEAAFSFLTFDTARTTINVHVQLLLTLTTESGEVRRRRMLLQSGGDGEDENGNAFRSYIGTASVAEEETTPDPLATDAAFARFSFGFIPAMLVVVISFIMG